MELEKEGTGRVPVYTRTLSFRIAILLFGERRSGDLRNVEVAQSSLSEVDVQTFTDKQRLITNKMGAQASKPDSETAASPVHYDDKKEDAISRAAEAEDDEPDEW